MTHTLGQIGIIGNGSWGTAIAKILTDNGHHIHWWMRTNDAIQSLEHRHHNLHYLTSVRFLPETITPTNNLQELVTKCDTLVVAVPSAYVQEVIGGLSGDSLTGKNVISAIKGILPGCNKLLNDYLLGTFEFPLKQYVAITGPCHAEEVAEERLSYLTFSGLDDALTQSVAAAFKSIFINTTSTHDVWGAQYAAVLKNIYAIGAGMARSLDYGDNFMSVFITNCYREMNRFLHLHFEKVHSSPEKPDFHTAAYLGDLLVTCYSLHSRNRTFGSMIGKGYSVKSAILEMNMVAEGYYAAKCMQQVAEEFSIHLPLAQFIYKILWQDLDASDAFLKIEKLMS